jgi:hypothetical protein
MYTKLHDDRFGHSRNIKVIMSIFSEAASVGVDNGGAIDEGCR